MPPYVKQTWTDHATPVDGAHMTHIEDGIFTADANATTADGKATTALAQSLPQPVQNGKWIKGVGGAAVWSSIAAADIGGGYAPNKISVGAIAAGPPGSPSDGDIWTAVVDTSGRRWMFQYNAGSASPYKWEFVGGSAQAAGPGGSIATASTSYVDLTGGPTVSIARTGDYQLLFGCRIQPSGAALSDAALAVWNGSTTSAAPAFFTNGTAGGAVVLNSSADIAMLDIRNLTGGQTLNLRVAGNPANSATYMNGWLHVTPIRIS